MRCRQCDYALWDLPSRKCPECGAPFKPSEYEFTPGAVQYLCPHCRQSYYGTDAKGHLWPRSFTCVKCNRPIDMDEMLLVPAEGWTEEQTSAEKLPWLNRAKIGFFKGFFKTVWMAMTAPSRVMQLLPERNQASGRLWFAFVTHAFVGVVGFAPFLILQLVMIRGMIRGAMPVFALGGVGVAFLLATLVAPLIAIVLWSLATHTVVRLTGRTQGNFDDTFSVFCYSAGANAASAIPCLGLYFGWLWWLVSAILMLRERHKIHGGRATLAVCTAPVLGIAATIALNVFMLTAVAPTGSVFTATTSGPAGSIGYYSPTITMLPAGTSAEEQTDDLRLALVEYARMHNGHYPPHALMLAVEHHFDPYDFVAVGTPTMPEYVLLDNSATLLDFVAADANEQIRIAQRVVNKMPKNVVAHRIGDYVFTYHGVEKVSDPTELWLIIRHVPKTLGRSFAIYVATADGEILNYSEREFPVRLQQQNALRAAAGLPPLPHPDKLTHDSPIATGDDTETDAAPQQ